MEENDCDIAIVGIGCMFPGAKNADEFWRVLLNGENHVIDIPKERWNVDAFYSENKDDPAKSYVKKAGLLQGYDEWDNHIYGISETEAIHIDPQQRYVLDCVHMALEDGGFTKVTMDGSDTGVYIGCMNDDYKSLAVRDLDEIISYTITGLSATLVSARVSYTYNLQGPCMTLDTACSSALVAVHLGCQAIKSGDCDQAICGGVNSILSPDVYPSLCKARMMSTIGQCQTFCDTADGYIRGEGCGIVILKRYKQAIKDHNKIWAVIKTGTNQDGATVHPITAPSGEQQEKLLQKVYRNHKIDPASVQYIETHGTGTPIGDPTETNCLGHFFHQHRRDKGLSDPILLGSVKSNIGHLESAAGVASLIKVLLMMKHGKIVPSLHVKPDKSNINKKLLLTDHNLDIALNVQEWRRNESGERIGCVNCFGFGGSNSHAIVIQKNGNDEELKEDVNKLHIACLSSVDRSSLEKSIKSFAKDVGSVGGITLTDIAYTSCLHREHFPYRVALVADSKEDLLKQCELKLRSVNKIVPQRQRNVIFLFCGVGTTWNGMCQEIMKQNKVFRETIELIDTFLEPLAGWKIGSKFQEETDYDDPLLNHVAIFAVQVALTEVWKALGIEPSVIVGQSVGEVAAAYAAGILPLEEAIKVAYYRSYILAQHLGGTMMVVGNKAISETEKLCQNFQDVSVGVYISPVACTLTGNETELLSLKRDLEKDSSEYLIRVLKVKCAYHSKQVEGCKTEMTEKLASLKSFTAARTPIVSTVTGCLSNENDFKTGTYWADNIRKPVKFGDAVRATIDKDSYNIFVEIGPRPVLGVHLQNILIGERAVSVPSMNVKKELGCLYSSLSTVFESGIDVSWNSIYNYTRIPSPLPKYNFNRTKKLLSGKNSRQYLSGIVEHADESHMFIKHLATLNGDSFQILIDEVSTPFVQDHTLSGTVLVPGATYVEVGLHIGMKLLQKPINELAVSLEFLNPVTPVQGQKYVIIVKTKHRADNEIALEGEHGDRSIFRGKVGTRTVSERPVINMNQLNAQCTSLRNQEESYACLEKLQYKYGPSLRLVEQSFTSLGFCLSKLRVPESISNEMWMTHFHPAILDGIFQTFGMLEWNETDVANLIPKGIKEFVVYGPPQNEMYVYARQITETDTDLHFNALLLSPTGHVLAEVNDFFGRKITDSKDNGELGYVAEWTEIDLHPFKVDKEKRILLVTTGYSTFLASKLCDKFSVETHDINDADNGLKNNETIETVVIHVSAETNESIDGNFIDESSLQLYQYMKSLLLQMLDEKRQFSLSVVTELTQNKHVEKKMINLFGAELWGMMRSARDEMVIDDIRLIDIDPEQLDVELLASVVANPSLKQADLLLIGSKLYQAKLVRFACLDVKIRDFKIGQDEEASLMSINPVKIEGAFLYKQTHGRLNVGHDSNMVRVKVSSFVQPDNSVYITTTEPLISPWSLWPDLHENFGYHIIMLEGTGTVILDTEGAEKEIVRFCYPVAADTSVNIPMECLINSDSLHEYAPGILVSCCIIYSQCLQVPENSKIVVVDKSQNDADFGLLYPLLCQKGCKVKRHSLHTSTSHESAGDENILLFTNPVDATQIKALMRNFPKTKQVIASSHAYPQELVTWMHHMFPVVQLCILSTSEIFFKENIKALFPRVRQWLADINSTVPTPCQLAGLTIPQKNVDLDKLKCTDKLSLRVDRLTLFRENGCYIVVGGLTGLGWLLVNCLCEIGAGYIAIFGRRSPSENQLRDIKALENKGTVHVISVPVDVTNIDSLKNAVSQVKLSFKGVPIKGIFHGAGVLADSLLINQTVEQMTTAMKPKILGAWNLHMISLEMELDFFVMHSSIVSVIGNAGQCNYAAGNSFLDSLAAYRRARGLCAQSINWGPLAVGMAVHDSKLVAQLQAQGFTYLNEDEIKNYFVQALLTNEVQIIFTNTNWDLIVSKPSFASQIQKFEGLLHTNGFKKQTMTSNDSILPSSYLAELKNFDNERKKNELKKLVVSTCCDVFVVREDMLSDASKLVSIGIDSMSAMSFVNAMYKILKIRIPVVKLLSEQTTLNGIIEYFFEHLANTEHQVNDGVNQFQGIFNSEIAFNKDYYLKHYFKNKRDISFIYLIDVEFIDLKLTAEQWRNIFEFILCKHSELRIRYKKNVNGSISEVLDSLENISLPVENVEYSVIAETVYIPEREDPRNKYFFDIETELPIKFQLAQQGSSTLLRMILHEIVGDMMSVLIIFDDMATAMQQTLAGRTLETTWPELNIQSHFKKAFLQKMQSMYSFWKAKLNLKPKPLTLDTTLQALDPKYYTLYEFDIPVRIVSSIETYVEGLGITLFHFMASVYQLLLYLETKQDIITVFSPTDLRIFIPELTGKVARFSQYVPLIARITQSNSVREFIKKNAEELMESLENSCFPTDMIIDLFEDDMKPFADRHLMVLDYTKYIKDATMTKGEISARLKQVLHMPANCETAFLVFYDKHTRKMTFEFSFNSKSCGLKRGQGIPHRILSIIEELITKDTRSISSLLDAVSSAFGDTNTNGTHISQTELTDSYRNLSGEKQHTLLVHKHTGANGLQVSRRRSSASKAT